MKVEIKRDICIGAATCSALAPDVFELDEEMKAILKRTDGTKTAGPAEYADMAGTEETIMEAAQSCPTLAIYIYDDAGKQVFPLPADS